MDEFDEYFAHLQKLSWVGRIYHTLFKIPLLYFQLRRFGPEIVEVGSGIGNGVLGASYARVAGLDINPRAVKYCQEKGLNARIIGADGVFPIADNSVDACLLDNVLEHIPDPKTTLDQCWRITRQGGGLIIVVPGLKGFASDPDHKVFYGVEELRRLDGRWTIVRLFSIPLFILNDKLSKALRQYCLVMVYRKD